MSKQFTLQETVAAVAAKIKETIADYEAFAENLRKKELESKHGKKLAKSLCLICAEAEFECSCLNKSELAKKTPPDISEKTMHKLKDEYGHDKKGKEKAYATAWSIENKIKYYDGMAAEGAGDPMTMSEMCKSCGKSGDLCKCMGKTEVTSVPAGKPNAGSGGETKKVSLEKAALPSVKHPEVQGVGGKQPVGMGGGDANKIGTATAQNTPALASAKGVPNTSVSQVNKEMAGFKSIASDPTAMPGNVKSLSIPKAPRVNPKMAAPASQRFHGALPLQRTEVK